MLIKVNCGVFICVLGAYDIYKKNTVLFTSHTILLIYVNKIENRITFKIKTGYYLALLTSETMKLFGGTKSEITKDKNGENVPHLETG